MIAASPAIGPGPGRGAGCGTGSSITTVLGSIRNMQCACATRWIVPLKVTFGYCLYCGMQKLYYVLPSGYISRYQLLTISNKSAEN